MLIHVDNSEQLAYAFEDVPSILPYVVERVSLDTADYLVCRRRLGRLPASYPRSDCAIVERKSLADLYGTLGNGRERFVRELERMVEYGYRAIVIEATWAMIMSPNQFLKHPTQMNPRSVIASLLAWSQRYNVHLFPFPDRAVAERMTFRILERWFRDGAEH